MKIIITEEQFDDIFGKKKRIPNDKPALNFDKLYGTNLSQQYDFSPYTEDEIWDRWTSYSNYAKFDGDPKPFLETLKILPKAFPYIDVNKYDVDTKRDIMLGMVSGFNPEDIYYFSILKVPYYKNIEQKLLEEKLPPEVTQKIQWVLSPSSIEVIKNRFSVE